MGAAAWKITAELVETADLSRIDISSEIADCLGGDLDISHPLAVRSQLSLETVIALINWHLPGWAWKIGTCSVSDDAWLCPDYNDPAHRERLIAELGEPVDNTDWRDAGIDIDRRPPGNVELALLEAFCLAMAYTERAKW